MWNQSKVISNVKQHEIVTAYKKHKLQLGSIHGLKKPYFSTELEYQFPVRKSIVTMKPEKEKQRERDACNTSLINKMININKHAGDYNKQSVMKNLYSPTVQTLNIPFRLQTLDKINNDNQTLDQRLKQTKSTIRLDLIQQDYQNSQKYKENISRNSRRIFNCFLSPQNMDSSFHSQRSGRNQSFSYGQNRSDSYFQTTSNKQILPPIKQELKKDLYQSKSTQSLYGNNIIFSNNDNNATATAPEHVAPNQLNIANNYSNNKNNQEIKPSIEQTSSAEK